ncbi:sterol desaturase family protein [Nocardioides sp. HDW12B]|uniref:sterol desaturase family protein n=1 Tax=Nocardioides sp. HDW12B TaxID=2714939 RepID=UPI001408EB1E|nr:sterol desaturase family protein [Nocardioides sp. HDW12B]QIK65006.1 sterol desaturase family protein [Nocardioides sp. HDW12B]
MTTVLPRAQRGLSLGDAAREFARHPSPWMLGGLLVAAAAARLLLEDWRLSDLLAPAAFLALFPVVEWLVHVFVLHWRPRRLGPVTLDTQLARKHREHHASPRDVPLVFIPWQTLAGLVVVVPALALLAFPRPHQALAFVVTVAVVGLVYEWVHYLVHSDYRPRSRAYRAVHRHHRLHHFKNENYWLTVTSAHTADRIFGTDPDPADVPTSATAKDLHGLQGTGH